MQRLFHYKGRCAHRQPAFHSQPFSRKQVRTGGSRGRRLDSPPPTSPRATGLPVLCADAGGQRDRHGQVLFATRRASTVPSDPPEPAQSGQGRALIGQRHPARRRRLADITTSPRWFWQAPQLDFPPGAPDLRGVGRVYRGVPTGLPSPRAGWSMTCAPRTRSSPAFTTSARVPPRQFQPASWRRSVHRSQPLAERTGSRPALRSRAGNGRAALTTVLPAPVRRQHPRQRAGRIIRAGPAVRPSPGDHGAAPRPVLFSWAPCRDRNAAAAAVLSAPGYTHAEVRQRYGDRRRTQFGDCHWRAAKSRQPLSGGAAG